MSLKTLPLLFINLGGEMMYILDQRLRAQNIQQDKARKVLHDIIGTMFNKRFMDELFKQQELFAKKSIRTVFDRLAHASIMRLNSASMDKLYDLMMMALKYQVSLCPRANDILLVTLNHLDMIRTFTEDSPSNKPQVDYVFNLLLKNYGGLLTGEFVLIRQTLLNFFQDMHIRVSIFLKDKVQNHNGRFALATGGQVPWGTELPGTIRLYNEAEELVKTNQFSPGGKHAACPKPGSYDLVGDRVTKLGTNMYNVSRPVEAVVDPSYTKTVCAPEKQTEIADPNAKAQLDLLSQLIGGGGGAAEKKASKFRLNLFRSDEEEEQAQTLRLQQEDGSKVISIDASKKKQSAELSRIMGELQVSESSGGADEDDLLDLMDSAAQ